MGCQPETKNESVGAKTVWRVLGKPRQGIVSKWCGFAAAIPLQKISWTCTSKKLLPWHWNNIAVPNGKYWNTVRTSKAVVIFHYTLFDYQEWVKYCWPPAGVVCPRTLLSGFIPISNTLVLVVVSNICFIFTPNLGEMIQLDECFSDGLKPHKPPTSYDWLCHL